MFRKRLSLTILALAIATAALVTGPITHAHAYGSNAVYQITMSFNCQNKTLCQASPSNPFGIGGGWGWIELDSGGTGDIQFEGQGHNNADPLLNGAIHFSGDVSWWTNGTLLFISTPAGLFVLPAAPGHYGGPSGPGINNEIQVSLIPH
jgi:hypothetical protein